MDIRDKAEKEDFAQITFLINMIEEMKIVLESLYNIIFNL
jgi:hypothetical protein